ncbi:MAG: PAS domain-containing protein, partial [Sulfuricurvum sp.]|nr:PAS domain-containing protein [Sulfuricurvum sp.]
TVTHKEATFGTNELFFSITQKDSTIVSGNGAFIRISGYPKDELIGRYHNIVRHPEMPKVIFKTFWERLEAKKPIVAYVQNRAKNGDHYWVIAAVFPLEKYYLSIRIKPNSPLFSAIKDLYHRLLEEEGSSGIAASEHALEQGLNTLGYSNYDQFMGEALLGELQERKRYANPQKRESDYANEPSEWVSRLNSIHRYASDSIRYYERWFEKIGLFKEMKVMFEEKSLHLRHLGREIVFLSLNTSVSSHKMETGGETFGILARDIRINAKENDAIIGRIHTKSNAIAEVIHTIIFSVSAIRLQFETLIRFVEEILTQTGVMGGEEIRDNLNGLIELVQYYASTLKTVQYTIEEHIQENLDNMDLLERQVMYLGYIQIYGMIEASRISDPSVGFGGIFSQLKDLIEQTSSEIEIMRKTARGFHAESVKLIQESNTIEKWMGYLQSDSAAVNTMGGIEWKK